MYHLRVLTREKRFVVTTTKKTVKVYAGAKRGLPGSDGTNGVNGTNGIDGEGDKYFTHNINGETDFTVNHGLGKYPSVTVIDSANDEVEGDYQFINLNEVRLKFVYGFSGKAIFN